MTSQLADRIASAKAEGVDARPASRSGRSEGDSRTDDVGGTTGATGSGATAVGAYTPRARPGAPVSMPVSWDEIENGVRPDEFTVETVPQRLAGRSSDPWAEIGKIRQSVSAAVRRQVGI